MATIAENKFNAKLLTKVDWITDIVSMCASVGMSAPLVQYHIRKRHVRVLEIGLRRWFDRSTVDMLTLNFRPLQRSLIAMQEYAAWSLPAPNPRLNLTGPGMVIHVPRAVSQKTQNQGA